MKTTAIAATFFALACVGFAAETDAPLLARIDVPGPLASFPLPVFAQLQDATGQDYVLVVAAAGDLQACGWNFRTLDAEAAATDYVLAFEFRTGARAAAAQEGFRIVLDDGRRLVIRSAAPAADVESLGRLGFQCRRLPAAPLDLAWSAPAPTVVAPKIAVSSNAWVAEMIARIQQTNLTVSLAELTGVQPVAAGGSYTNVRSRHQNSGTGIRRATELAYERFHALGLQPSYQAWSAGGYSNRNVIGTLPGTLATAGTVVVCAHIDDMPSGATAPGADDNASGSVAVFAAAEVLRRYSFERTLRFVLFTGEEQGLYGSDAYAAAAKAAGETNLVALNLDMVAWDGNGDKVLNLYVRPGNAVELDAAATFTNVARVYGLATGVVGAVVQEAVDWSDHYSFNSYGLPAICLIEEDVADFNPYYHTTNDVLARLNLPFFTHATKALAGTAAHLARPVQRLTFDAIRIQNGAFLAATNVGVGTFVARHESGAAEGYDARDAAAAMATNPNAAWLKIYTAPYATNLAVDARPTDSETIFRGQLAVVKTNAGNLTCTNRLKFEFAGGTDTNCAYVVKVTVDSNATPNRAAFACATNLSQIVAGGGYLSLPGLANVANGTVYGTCEISRRFVSRAASNLVLRLPQIASTGAVLSLPCQLGVRVADSVEYATNLFPAAPWVPLAAFTNDPVPDAAGFETGWTSAATNLDLSGTGNSPALYFRVKRRWLPP
mgnify:CR=1 FL=1